jgi:phosphonate C-P lyase system protein PhnG
MSLLATSSQSDLLNLWEQKKIKVNYVWLRTPEIGSIMAQGRMGVTGDKFNIGDTPLHRLQVPRSPQAFTPGPLGPRRHPARRFDRFFS